MSTIVVVDRYRLVTAHVDVDMLLVDLLRIVNLWEADSQRQQSWSWRSWRFAPRERETGTSEHGVCSTRLPLSLHENHCHEVTVLNGLRRTIALMHRCLRIKVSLTYRTISHLKFQQKNDTDMMPRLSTVLWCEEKFARSSLWQ